MKKVELKLDVHDEKSKRKAMRMVSSLSGLDSMSMNMKEKKLTLTGDIDPVVIVSKLRKVYHTEIISVGPVKEPEKKKDEPKKAEPNKKDEPNKDQQKKSEVKEQPQIMTGFIHPHYNHPLYPSVYYARSVEEDPNACVIC